MNLKRVIAYLAAMAIGLASAVAAALLKDPVLAWGCGLIGGAVLVTLNVLTHRDWS